MSEQRFTATLSPGGPGRSGWCVIFRHPVRLGSDGKPGLRIRRGLGTSDRAEAQRLVDQANAILGDQGLWTVSSKDVAEKRYDKRIVNAFYDDIVPTARDGWALRDEVIPLPSSEGGCTRVLLMGATGAGKTTLVRQLIGTGGENEKFPSISTAKTTTCDIEVILARDNEFTAVVSFLTKEQVRQLVEECVCAAALSCVNDEEEDVVRRRFLEHSEQRFRLSYLLGAPPASSEDTGFRDRAEPRRQMSYGAPATVAAVNTEEREQSEEKLQAYLDRVRQVTEASKQELEHDLGSPLEGVPQSDKDAFEELLEDRLHEQQGFQELVDDILDDVESRFGGVQTGQFEKDPQGWPVLWKYRCATKERGGFIRTINYFGSNQAPWFGKLLTPLVDGIRVRGPFAPSIFADGFPDLVLMDGEGLGHAANAGTSVSTRITRRYETADVILLVDNAMQPMLAAPMGALRSLVTSGQQSKLIMAFTHLDQVEGDNLPTESARRRHVLASVDNVIRAFRVESGKGTENVLKRISRERTFFFHNLQDPLSEASAKSYNVDGKKEEERNREKEELGKLIDTIRTVGSPPVPVSITPVYDDANLVLCIQKAAQEFREPWRARLGLGSGTYIEQEHWARIKALTRRLGLLGQDEYDNLRPVADFICRLQERIHPFLGEPLRWEPNGGTPEMMTEAIDLLAREVFAALHEIANERIVKRYAIEWQVAYGHRGHGSAAIRSRDVETIYEGASPIPGLTANPTANHFLREVRLAIRDAIKVAGGKLVGIEDQEGPTRQ